MSIESEDQPIVTAPITQGFQAADRSQNIGAPSAVFLRNGQSLDPELGTLLPCVPGEFLFQVAFNQPFIQLLLSKADDFPPKGCLFFIPSKLQERPSPRP